MRRLPRFFLSLATLLVALSAPVAAQSADHDAAFQVITRLFDAMRARDTTAMRNAFVPNASMQTLSDTAVRFNSIDGWINSIARARSDVVLDERVANPVVHIDGMLASIWVDYWFFVGDRFSHCGVDAVLLAKQAGTWRIFSIVDTRRTTGCPPAPAN